MNEKTLDFDPWDSVHFYALDVVANIVISAFWENQGAKRFLKKMITTGTFEKVLNLVEGTVIHFLFMDLYGLIPMVSLGFC